SYILNVVNQQNGCEAYDTAALTLPVPPTDMIASIEIPICAGDMSGTISVSQIVGGTPVYTYSLDGGAPQNSPDFIDLTAGTYAVLVTDSNGCTYEESFTIPDGQILTIDIGPDLNLELGDSVILNPLVNLPWSQIDSIVWALGDHLSCTHCINPTYYALVPTETITATVYASGCLDQDAVNITVDIDADFWVPNVFSPNDDGINDRVTVFADPRVKKIVYLEIFDRWGNQVFVANNIEPNDPLLGWDGKFKNKPMNPAVFAYIAQVELINGVHVNKKGDITLIR
ncbi:MAG TPA: gliding motility-associated C-terminal domain-containing protein, partial [Allocoleopsis sp.]